MVIICCISFKDILTLIIGIVGLSIALIQLSNLNKNRKADFIHRFKKDSFNDIARQITFLIDFDALTFIEPQSDQEYPYFKINKDKLDKMPEGFVFESFKGSNYAIDALKIDDHILGHFEDIGFFEKEE